MFLQRFGLNDSSAQQSEIGNRWSSLHVLLFLCVIVSWLIAWTMPFTNEDLFLALCAGRDIFAGKLAVPDQWCFSSSGIIWVDHSWLSHLIYYLLYRWLEDLGPVLLKAALLSGCLGLLYFRCRALSVPRGISMIALTLGTLSFAPFLKIRAENFGMFYFVLLTTILTLPPSQGKWRYPASLLVLGLWSNGHGSFMLGFLLIALRFFITLLYRIEAKRGEFATDEVFGGWGKDMSWWAVTLALSGPVMAFANPYGPENLFMAFPQSFAKPITDLWIDWQPLIHGPSLFDRGFFKAFSTRPFMIMLAFTLCSLVSLIAMTRKRTISSAMLVNAKSDLLMEAFIALMTLPLVFRYQRMIVFAAPAFVPIMAAIMHGWANNAADRFPRIRDYFRSKRGSLILALPCFIGLACLVLVLYKTVIRFSGANPLNSTLKDRGIASRLMTHNLSRVDVVQFLKKNRIHARVITNLFLSNYLLFHAPDLTLFFDLRPHIFPETVMRTYLSIFNPRPDDLHHLPETVGRSGAELVILDTVDRPSYFNLALLLMESKRWVCIYKDEYLIILAKSDFGLIRSSKDPERLDHLWYSRPETRIVSEAFASHFSKGSISPELLGKLKESLEKCPDPEAYALLAAEMKGNSECLNQQSKDFLASEATKLVKSSTGILGGALTYLQSASRLLLILDQNDASCHDPKAPYNYRSLRDKLTAIFDTMKKQYGGI